MYEYIIRIYIDIDIDIDVHVSTDFWGYSSGSKLAGVSNFAHARNPKLYTSSLIVGIICVCVCACVCACVCTSGCVCMCVRVRALE